MENKKYYIIIDCVPGTIWNEAHETEAEAIAAAVAEWQALTQADRDRREAYYIIVADDPDELDGDIIKVFK